MTQDRSRRYKVEVEWDPPAAEADRIAWAGGSLTYDTVEAAAFRAGAIVASAPRVLARAKTRVRDRVTGEVVLTGSIMGGVKVKRS